MLYLFSLLISFDLLAGLNVSCTLECISAPAKPEAVYKSCNREDDSYTCDPIYQDMMAQIKTVFSLATTGICSASASAVEEAGIEIPPCSSRDSLDQSDPRNASSGVFLAYSSMRGSNANTIKEFIEAFRANDSASVINLVIDIDSFDNFMGEEDLQVFLKEQKINFVPMATSNHVTRWMQDSFQFVTIDQKPAIYQLEQHNEARSDASLDLNKRLACQIAKQCDIPYYAPESMVVDPAIPYSSLNSGGNLEVIPGGTYIQGTVQSYFEGQSNNPPNFSESSPPFQTVEQAARSETIRKNGNKVIDLDISFLWVGHVDEMVNFVKTNNPPPCDFAMLYASPSKAIEMMKSHVAKTESSTTDFSQRVLQAINTDLTKRYGENTERIERELNRRGVSEADNCTLFDESIFPTGFEFTQEEYEESFKSLGCVQSSSYINGPAMNYASFIESEKFQAMVNINEEEYQPILEKNKSKLLKELSSSSGCTNPTVIDVPVLYDENGGSHFANSVNGLVQNRGGQRGSGFIVPDVSFEPFNDYIKTELEKVGVTTTFVDDTTYHNNQGEIHCGTNQIPLCN